LQSVYISDRQKSKDNKALTHNTIPITVRQLEAVIRLSEALAKMKLKNEVTGDEVDEAHYLFQVSTMKTIEGK
jgi:DNA replication licensing factor MCM5